MPTFSERRLERLNDAIRKQFERMRYWHKSNITHEELLVGFVQPDHRRMVSEVGKVCNVSGLSSFMATWGVTDPLSGDPKQVRMHISMTDPDKAGTMFLVPGYAGESIMYDRPESLKIKLTTWVMRRLAMSREFGNIHSVLNSLNNVCDSPQALRMVFPGVLALISQAAESIGGVSDNPLTKLHDQLQAAKFPRDMPAIPLALRTAAKEATTTLARVALLEKPEQNSLVIYEPVMLSLHDLSSSKGWNGNPMKVFT